MAGFVGNDPGRSVMVRGRGVSCSVNGEVVRLGASVNKLFVAAALVLAEGADNEVLGATTVSIAELPPSRFPSVTLALAPEHRLSLLELTALMLATSDNRIADHLVARIGIAEINAAARSLGCNETTMAAGFGDDDLSDGVRATVTSARDCATVLDLIATDPRCAPLRPALRSSLFNTRILAHLPMDTVVSHKTGSLVGVVNDVGIIHAPGGDLTVCFLADGQPDSAVTSTAIAACARAVFDAAADFDAGDLDADTDRDGAVVGAT